MDVKLRGSFRFEAMRIISNSQKKSTRRQKVVTITRTNEQHKAIECMKFGKYVFIFDGFQVSNVRKKSEEEEKKNERQKRFLFTEDVVLSAFRHLLLVKSSIFVCVFHL